MERTHVASRDLGPTIKLRPVGQTEHRRHKPNGFWYEVDGDWRRWCRAEEWGDPDGPLYRVTLNGERMLNIRSEDELRAFNEEYGKSDWLRSDRYVWEVDWETAAEQYDGVEIAPYLWSMRFDTEIAWYYSWDCASGIIWQPKGVTVERIT